MSGAEILSQLLVAGAIGLLYRRLDRWSWAVYVWYLAGVLAFRLVMRLLHVPFLGS